MRTKINYIVTCCTFSLLVACGGGSSDSSSNTQPTTTPVVADSIVAYDENVKIGQAVDLFLYVPNKNVSSIQWQQTAGPSVSLLTATSKGIAFTPTESGNYSFDVSYSASNTTQTLTHTLTVSDQTSMLSARLGHVVKEGNKVSLRAFLTENQGNHTNTWQQLSGPQVSISSNDTSADVIFFNAPEVNQDTLIEFEVNSQKDGSTYTDKVAVLVEDAPQIPSNAYFEDPVAKVFPYSASSPYANTIVGCVYSNELSSSCTLSRLPLIANDTTSPTVDDIMDRVVVSHQWMGDRFKDFLLQNDANNDFKNLLRATTAVVISYDVRPSFYWAATGAIYLDANNFWITPDERDTINEAADFRSAFGNDLQFIMPWRYVKNNDYVNVSYPEYLRVTRQTTDGLYRLTSLMYHELAHANDFFPSTEWNSHDSDDRILDAAQTTNFESDKLDIVYPLSSTEMRALAQVSFHGESASDNQKALLPDDIASYFSNDIANDYYNYSSKREDYAMLFDELMMFARFGINRDVAITNRPTGSEITASDYIVSWGQRGRIGEPSIKPRLAYVAERVLPEFSASAIIDDLPTPIAMVVGNDWVSNLTISPIPLAKSNSDKHALSRQEIIETKQKKAPIAVTRYYNKKLPKH